MKKDETNRNIEGDPVIDSLGIEWRRASFGQLHSAYLERSAGQPLTVAEEEFCLRYENILLFIEEDKIWPPIPVIKAKFTPSLCEVLSRLPNDDFYTIDGNIQIVLEGDASCPIIAVNVPANAGGGINSVVFFHPWLRFTSAALAGLIAHEFAHSFVQGRDYAADEAASNEKAREWGFGKELACLDAEKRTLFGV